MTALTRGIAAAWEFVVGDDWVTAVGVIAAIGLAAIVQSTGVAAWWLVPAAALGLLLRSVSRERRRVSTDSEGQ